MGTSSLVEPAGSATHARNGRSIPSLDGLRALSVLAVVSGHTQSAFLDGLPFKSLFHHEYQGVAMFFVISGFLITHLLLKELRRDGSIDLKRFYLRRTLRIFPPFYAYLAAIAILIFTGRSQINATSMLAAATYTWNYIPQANGWLIGHCWSLTLEEQFYLLWPVCMSFFSRRVNLRIAIGVIVLSPLSRVVTYVAVPAFKGKLWMMLHTRLDTIMMGCLLALLIEMNLWPRIRKAACHPVAVIAAVSFLLFAHPPLEERWKGWYSMPAGISLENVAMAVILLYAVFCHESPLGKVLNSRPLRHLGVISYSLYLWQQLFTGPQPPGLPLNVLFIVVCAELSYFLVERPSLRIRDRLEKLLAARGVFAGRSTPATVQ